ncbi:MAG: bifunctional diaminohydroxyphosphoribosylaminopyrimidine deaminase/5-amino-6-(5-phosphoribosylamino)uracil reductase RibD [Hyphomonadaceae bacterium]
MNANAWMARALALAQPRAGKTGDNPAVGCVVVREEKVVAEAATAEGGRPHAEEQALEGIDAEGAVAYITLEPCAERTSGVASCAQRLVDAKVARVVIAARDPHPQASGRGIALLVAAGIDVQVGVMEAEAKALNADFLRRWEAR